MLMSFWSMICTARRSCCNSARCETTQVASTPWLNSFIAEPTTSMPKARDTISSMNVKPRLLDPVFRCIGSSLPELRDIRVQHVVLGNFQLGVVVRDRNGHLIQGWNRGACAGRGCLCDRDGACVVGQRKLHVIRSAKDSIRPGHLQILRSANRIVRGSNDAIHAGAVDRLCA